VARPGAGVLGRAARVVQGARRAGGDEVLSAASLVRTVEVPVDPATAFRLFTEEIGEWYRSGAYSWNDPSRAVGIRFEPGIGGRLLEIWDEPGGGEGYELGRVLAWEPGARLVFEFRSAHLPPEPTEVEVRFEARPGGTRVTLEHRGLERWPRDVVERHERFAWLEFMRWFGDYASGESTVS
jgi:uncharacterized protein YndB with AHSA1/START domain